MIRWLRRHAARRREQAILEEIACQTWIAKMRASA